MDINSLTPEQQKHVASKLEELSVHPGWQLLLKIIDADREAYFRKVSDPSFTPAMKDLNEFNYNRGIIEATYRFSRMPQNLMNNLKFSILAKNEQDKPPLSGDNKT